MFIQFRKTCDLFVFLPFMKLFQTRARGLSIPPLLTQIPNIDYSVTQHCARRQRGLSSSVPCFRLLYLSMYNISGYTTYMAFPESQLSPNSISFSLLTRAHPTILQHRRVRSPVLARVSSFGFGSVYSAYLLFLSNFFAEHGNSSTHYAKGTSLNKCPSTNSRTFHSALKYGASFKNFPHGTLFTSKLLILLRNGLRQNLWFRTFTPKSMLYLVRLQFQFILEIYRLSLAVTERLFS